MNRHTLPPIRDYVAYDPGSFQTKMGLLALDLADWIEIDIELPDHLAEKRHLLTERHADVFAALPAGTAGSRETLAMLVAHLRQYFPQIYHITATEITNHVTDERWPLLNSALHPLEIAGRLVQEDLCLMSRDPTTRAYHLSAACLCFPTRWLLLEKLGQSLATIHKPTPRYAERLGVSTDRLFDRLSVEKPVWRTNWSLLDDGTLYQPTGHGEVSYQTDVTADNAGEKLWLRTERQTLRRLPVSGDILFTIRIYNQPLSSIADQPERAARLASAVRGLDETMRVYKSMPPLIEAAIAWLDRVKAGEPQ